MHTSGFIKYHDGISDDILPSNDDGHSWSLRKYLSLHKFLFFNPFVISNKCYLKC